MNRSRYLYRQYRGDRKPGIESCLDSLDGGKKTAEPPKCKETTFGRDDYLVRGNKRVHSQDTQRRRTVYQDKVGLRLDCCEPTAQRVLPVRCCRQLELRACQVDPGRGQHNSAPDPKEHPVQQSLLIDQGIVGSGRQGVRVDAKTLRQAALRVEIDQNNASAALG